MKKYASVKISYLLLAFFLGALVMFLCSIFGAVHAVSMAAAEAESRPVIVLDAGHGGEDGGAVGVGGVEEKTINLAIAVELYDKLTNEGFHVIMVRETDVAVGDTTLSTVAERKRSDIQYRAELVNSTNNCLLISIHQNFFEQNQYSGAQMFYSGNNAQSAVLAESIRREVVSRIQPENTRENKQAESGIYLLNHVSVPAVIVECGFISNAEEAELLSDPAYQKRMAEAIAAGVANYCLPDTHPETAGERAEFS